MNGRRLLVVAAVALAVLGPACTSRVAFQPVAPVSPPPGGRGGDAVAPAPVRGGQRYLFRRDRPPVEVRAGSRRLARAVAGIRGLTATPLPSTEDAEAVYLVEDAPDRPWGAVLQVARPRVIRAFLRERDGAGWLILVTDVVVHRLRDPVPPTAYRWSRREVEDYARCGIPDSGTNECTVQFFRRADTVVLAPQGGPPVAR